MNRTFESLRLLCVLAATSTAAHADPEVQPGETIYVVEEPPAQGAEDRDRALGQAPFVTVVRPADRPSTASVGDALATSAGAVTTSLGGFGAYQSVSVRGASPGHTSVLIDGVPLAKLAAVTVDLGRYPLDSFGEVRFYRGAVPVELGGAGVGGAIDLVTKLGPGPHGERWSATLGVGSYGARHFRARHGDRYADGRYESATTIGYQGSSGDYSYFDDNGTLLNPRDDGYKTRGNNGFDQVDAATRWAVVPHPAELGLRVAWKREGLPGSTSAPAMHARLGTFDAIADLGDEERVAGWTARNHGYVLLELQRLRDDAGELGLGRADRSYTTGAFGLASTWHHALGPHAFAAGAEFHTETFRDHDDAPGGTDATSGARVGGAVSAAIDLVLARQLVVTPAMRFEALDSAPTPLSVGPMAGQDVPSRWDLVPSPRVTALFSVTPDVAIKGSAGLYARLPTLLEAFGNRGFILGTPDLKAERGPSSDLGAVWAPARALAGGAIDRVLVQGDVFANRAHDTIALVTYAGYVTRAANIGDTQGYGAELMASARFAQLVGVTASYTRLVTEQMSNDINVDGKPVPRRPGHVLYARADAEHRVMRRAVSLWLDGAWQSESFLDPASLGTTPARLLLGAGARIEVIDGVGLALAVANLADVRISHLPLDPAPSPALTSTPTPLTDVAGFPLPGRSFYVSLDWTH